jgi:5-methyltetrahydropteroyltriglutamate--homocysteine methyltransferase
VSGKLHWNGHPVRRALQVLKAHTEGHAEDDHPAPSVLHFRGGRKGISKTVYPDLDAFFTDLAQTYKGAVKAFYDAGCR